MKTISVIGLGLIGGSFALALKKVGVAEKIIGVDGVIVGSAFVKHIIDDSLSNDEKIKKISSVAKEIKEKINE